MPTYPLQGTSSQTMPARMLVADPSSSQPLDLRLELEGDDAPARDARAGLPDFMLAVPPVTGAWTIVVSSRNGQPFPPGATVTLRVTHNDGRSQDPMAVLVSDAGVGGVSRCPVLRIEPRDADRVRVARVGQGEAEQQLGPIGEAARSTARSAFQRAGRHVENDLVCHIDASASMRPWLKAGVVAIVLEAVAGIDSLTGAEAGITFSLGDGPTRTSPARDVAARLEDAVGELHSSGAFAWPDAPERGRLVVVTDTIPAEWRPEHGSLVVLSEYGAWETLRPADTRGMVGVTGAGPQQIAEAYGRADGPELQHLVNGIVASMVEAAQ